MEIVLDDYGCGGAYQKAFDQELIHPWNDFESAFKLSATYIQGRIVQPPGQMPGSHREGCLPSEHSWFIVISPQYPKPHLEDGDCVVADHVGPGE